MKKLFNLHSKYQPAGSQPQAIDELVNGLSENHKQQVLLGVTGSGKTFSIANVIARLKIPTLVISHNKTLAAQLTQEFRDFFPESAVGYFVSYYDYYQPEAYLPNSDTYIEKEATINEEIDRLRNYATEAILSQEDVIVVSSVSCIYGLGSPEFYQKSKIDVFIGQKKDRLEFMRELVNIQFVRNDAELVKGSFRSRSSALEIVPASEDKIIKIVFSNDEINDIQIVDKLNRSIIEKRQSFIIFPAKHYLIPENLMSKALLQIELDLEKRLSEFRAQGKIIEAERLSRKTRYDLEMIRSVGYCNGIENYSRYFYDLPEGNPPFTLIDYFRERWGDDFLVVIDESHVTVPQIGGMYAGDRSRKNNLIDYGFRLPSALDNRPLKFDEFENSIKNVIYVSATPAQYELQKSNGRVVEQIVRPTGLIDPKVEIRPTQGQVKDLISEAAKTVSAGERILVTTLTKKMAEDLTGYLKEKNIKVKYLHSDIETIERIRLISALRSGEFDVLIGVNLLREGLDMPEVSLVVILDADKEGFLRSETSLVQTIGRAARNVNGRVILYADRETRSMSRALEETKRRREIQLKYNKDHNITPKTIEKKISSIASDLDVVALDNVEQELSEKDIRSFISDREEEMKQAAKELRFEEATIIRDQLSALKKAGKFFKKTR
jgi:excinuclease ABC subunit B